MKRLATYMVMMIALLGSAWAQGVVDSANSLRMEVENIADEHAAVSWNSLGSGSEYEVERRLPGETAFRAVGRTRDTVFNDTIRKRICSDTVLYRITCQRVGIHYISNTRGVLFSDPYPTTGCEMKVVSVDEATQKIVISWEASPDADIMGYLVCKGPPWLAIDTVWGRENTRYVCENLAATEVHSFRICAFDSCYSASPLTGASNNMVVKAETEDCETAMHLAWNRYYGMPDSVGGYEVQLRFGTGAFQTVMRLVDGIAATYSMSGSVTEVDVRIAALNNGGTLCAYSNTVKHRFSTSDSAQFLWIRTASAAADNQSVELRFWVDGDFEVDHYTLYRRQPGGEWNAYEQLHNEGASGFSYSDESVDLNKCQYEYRLGVLDGCGRNEKYSNTMSTLHLDLENLSSGGTRLGWNRQQGWGGVTPYQIWRKTEHGTWQNIATTYGTDYTDPLTDITISEPLLYRVAAIEDPGDAFDFGDTLQSQSAQYVQEGTMWFPSAFTPEMETNRQLCALGSFMDAASFRLYIYNRMGVLVFSSNNPEECWDGRHEGRVCPQGVYVYMVFCRMADGTYFTKSGSVVLVR